MPYRDDRTALAERIASLEHALDRRRSRRDALARALGLSLAGCALLGLGTLVAAADARLATIEHAEREREREDGYAMRIAACEQEAEHARDVARATAREWRESSRGMVGTTAPSLDDWYPDRAALHGRAGVVVFVAPDCGPCRELVVTLARLRAEPVELAIVVIMEAPSSDDRAAFEVPLAFPILRDAGHVIAARYGVSSSPAAYFVDRRGSISRVHRGYVAGDARAIERAMREVVAR